MSNTITPTVFYRTLNLEGLEIFYREAGPRDAPTVLLLHGFPSSSHMFRNLIPMLADKYHVVAPDFPGYGESSAPSVNDFDYSFERLATVTEKFTEKLNFSSYALYLSDIDSSVGFRLAVMHPERVTAMIVQNGDAHVEAINKEFSRMNSKAAQLTENGTEIVRLFARFALGASFLSAVADRFGLWGPYGAKNVSWGNFAHFVEYTGAVTSLFPSSSTVSFAWAATVAETLLGILLIAGFKIRMASVLSGLLLLSFAIGMVTGLGIKTPFDYSVFSAAAAAFLLAFWEPDRFTLDKLLNRLRN